MRKPYYICLILGISSWTGLYRLLRGATLKLRELAYIQAAEAFGVSRWKIIAKHIIAAFTFMFGLVLPANLFRDAVRDALDPRLRTE